MSRLKWMISITYEFQYLLNKRKKIKVQTEMKLISMQAIGFIYLSIPFQVHTPLPLYDSLKRFLFFHFFRNLIFVHPLRI